jgi:hypothetical protein
LPSHTEDQVKLLFDEGFREDRNHSASDSLSGVDDKVEVFLGNQIRLSKNTLSWNTLMLDLVFKTLKSMVPGLAFSISLLKLLK